MSDTPIALLSLPHRRTFHKLISFEETQRLLNVEHKAHSGFDFSHLRLRET